MIEAIRGGDRRALARALTLVQGGGEAADGLLDGVLAHWPEVSPAVRVVGVTGPPGAGKSSLCDRFISHWRADGKRVAVLAVDPSSPLAGGALLGDRVRMMRHTLDAGVFVRSLAARGAAGGLARAVRSAVLVLGVAGFDAVLLETVGVGQSEVDVMFAADTVALVLTPGSGDRIQAAKAGILEIADILLVNKADLPGAEALAAELRHMLAVRRSSRDGGWDVPVVACSAQAGTGIDGAADAIAAHGAWLRATGQLAHRRERQAHEETRRQLLAIVEARLTRRLAQSDAWRTALQAVSSGRVTAWRAASQMADEVLPSPDGRDDG